MSIFGKQRDLRKLDKSELLRLTIPLAAYIGFASTAFMMMNHLQEVFREGSGVETTSYTFIYYPLLFVASSLLATVVCYSWLKVVQHAQAEDKIQRNSWMLYSNEKSWLLGLVFFVAWIIVLLLLDLAIFKLFANL